MTERSLIAITGTDRDDFLQGLVTNDINKPDGTLIYTALLTPQGKFVADFFVLRQANRMVIDVGRSVAATLAQKLSMYRLRADVQITQLDMIVSRGTGPAPVGAIADPRHPALGWRLYGAADESDDTDWRAVRVAHLVPETGIELTPDAYILECGFERLNGVDFRKGCFVGQEIVARMKHKTVLKKGLARVALDGQAAPGDAITADGKPAGTLHTISGSNGIAFLRFDRVKGEMLAGQAKLTRIDD